MESTTHLEQQSQTTRLFEYASYALEAPAVDAVVTLYDASFLRTCPGVARERASSNYNSMRRRHTDLKFELFPLHSPLLGESLLVSFPPLIDMLKFSGCSCLI